MLKLEPMQQVGASFLVHAKRALLADSMGSGKSPTTICAIEAMAELGMDPYPCLIICTNSMVYTWREEIERWAPGRTVGVLKGGAAARRKIIESQPGYLVINWEALASHTRLAPYGSIRLTDKDREDKELNTLSPRTVVADEAHRGKNPRAKQTRAWWRVAWDAEYSFALTGTPIIRTPEDLWSIMHGISPREWPSKTAWTDRYALKQWNLFGGLSITGLRGDTQDELFKYLDPRFIRRPTNVVIPNIADKLPPQVRRVPLSPKQQKAYDQMRKDMIAVLDDDQIVMATDHLVKMSRLLQLASAYGEIDENDAFTLVEPSCKVDAMMDVIDELDEEPAVFFAESKQLINLCAKKLEKEKISYGIITGDVEGLQRAQYVSQFQDGKLQAMLCTLGAGAEGITLTRARHVVFLQRSFSLAKNKQAEDRVWRRGQDKPVQPIYVISDNTLEQHVLDVGLQREATFEEVVRDRATLRKMLDM